MTWLLWLGVGGVVLVALALGLRAAGSIRWAQLVRTHTSALNAGNLGVPQRLPMPARFDARELECLPAPVQRYFRAVLNDGQPIIAATIDLAVSLQRCRLDCLGARRVARRGPGQGWGNEHAAMGLQFVGLPGARRHADPDVR